MAARVRNHFKISWTMRGDAVIQRADYLCDSVAELMECLRRDKGISVATTAMLCIHMILPNNRVAVIMDHDDPLGYGIGNSTAVASATVENTSTDASAAPWYNLLEDEDKAYRDWLLDSITQHLTDGKHTSTHDDDRVEYNKPRIKVA